MSSTVHTIRYLVRRAFLGPRPSVRRIHVPKVAVRSRYIHTQAYDRRGKLRPSIQAPVINARV
jgi:hypothetical protein